jgi:hypothetical protein
VDEFKFQRKLGRGSSEWGDKIEDVRRNVLRRDNSNSRNIWAKRETIDYFGEEQKRCAVD